jgi:Saxitoxin biosynthesis operon protein SxtJ
MALLAIDWRPSAKQLRNFGLIASAFAAGVGIWVFLAGSFVGFTLTGSTGRLLAYAFWGISGLCLAMAIVAPRGLRPLYVVLNAVTLPIGFVVSFLILSGLFYLLFTPVSIVFRLLGRDALHRQFDPQADSYWVPCERQKGKSGYFRQF